MDDVVFEPSVLRWAREKRFGPRFEILEDRLNESSHDITSEQVRNWEKGDSVPNFSQLKKLSALYKRPLAVFFLPVPPKEKDSVPDLRTIGSRDHTELSPEFLIMLRKARAIQANASELRANLGYDRTFPFRRYLVSDNPITLAAHVRDVFDMNTSVQFKSKTPDEFLEYLRGLVESTGVLTLKSGQHDSFPTEDCRAFTLADTEPYLILINNKDAEIAKTFSLMHEFAHVLLRTSSICNDYATFSTRRTANPVEVFCNQFAASFLVPADSLGSHLTLGRTEVLGEENIDAVIEALVRDYKVSRFVIIRRLRDIGLVDASLFNEKTAEWENDYIPPKTERGTFSLTTIIKKNGVGYSNLVFDAYRQGKISRSRISQYLGFKSKHIAAMEKLVQRYAG
jgi:Zn-dependent peptidase ImmA (M78 family)